MINDFFVYEWILMILGAAMGFVAIYMVVRSVREKDPLNVTVLIVMLAASLVMIGFPAIRSIEFSDGMFKIEKATRELEKNPADTVAQQKLVAALDKVNAKRAEQDPTALTTLAKAESAVGNYDKAVTTAQKAIELDKKSLVAQQTLVSATQNAKIQHAIEEKAKSLEVQLAQAESAPKDAKTIENIEKTVREIKAYPVRISESALLTVAKAAVFVENAELALEAAEVVAQSRKPAVKLEAAKLKKAANDKKRAPQAARPATISIDSQAIKFRLMPKIGK